MVAELQAFGGQEFGQFRDLGAIGGPLMGRERGAPRQREIAPTVDGVRGLGHDEDVGAHGDQEVAVGLGEVELLTGRALEQFDRVPTADAGEAERREGGLERLGPTRKLVAEFHPLDARLLGLGEAGLERRVAADLLEVVVRPADGVCPDADRHGS